MKLLSLNRIFISIATLALSHSPAWAQSGPVLDRVKSGGAIVIAHREASVPFSYFDANKKPVGYAVDLCMKLAQTVGTKLGIKTVPLSFLAVTPASRIDTIAQGKADMECGGTTNNKERREKVSFTVPHFITGVRMLVKASTNVERIEDLAGRTIAVTKGSTAQKAVDTANKERLIGVKLVEVKDHTEAVDLVEKDQAAAYMTDDVILFSLAATRPDPKSLKVVGKFLTIEPLAIILPKNDPEFKKIVDEEMKRMIRTREIYPIYDKWFTQAIPPKGITLNLPVSYLLRDFWKYPTDVVPF
ncbi:amino acid ABC transporter substrate-binding protein [Variovorax sp. PCZ-1]|uniref:amino acid ABC transporter substrate-binding protein n=1 Tax=Variovorax sp. PCZ-1 TaxID=2835533 RepID=UPI001BD0FD05|nr:amino acid ABC transporter substrate-binding protein [Variovorax sp. PCZ-1]MBS7808999.1 amino acid ABC transporter substrate-binding protein [Variovorax sp. PCZ-1]